MKPDVLIVGAGPVGLFTAIEAKLLNPKLHIKILERNKEYSRQHILRLDKDSLKNSEAYKRYDAINSLKGYVPTADIESKFLTIAQELGIEIERDAKITDAKKLYKDYPDTPTIIGADGAHSTIREQLFGDKKIVDKNLQYIVEIKYQAKGAPKHLSAYTYSLAMGQVNHLVSENVGKEKQGLTPVSLFVFVDEATYNEIRRKPNAQLKDLKPKNLLMEKLLNTIQPWLALRRANNEVMVVGSEKINGVALNIYQSETFAKELDGKNIYLVGDAAAAVPYFRALNAGLIAAQTTAKAIASSPNPDLKKLNEDLSVLSKGEIKRANKNNKTVNFGRGVNTFLSIGSKFTTASLLGEKAEQAMLEARVHRPNIFRRNPRITLGFIVFLILAGSLIPVFGQLLPMMGLAVLFAVGTAFAAVAFAQFVLRIKDIIKEWLNPPDPINPLPEFPWELHEDNEPMSDAKLAGLKGKKLDVNPKASNNQHFDSPIGTTEPRASASVHGTNMNNVSNSGSVITV